MRKIVRFTPDGALKRVILLLALLRKLRIFKNAQRIFLKGGTRYNMSGADGVLIKSAFYNKHVNDGEYGVYS